MENLKTCSRCRIEKPFTDFYKDSRTPTGLTCACKDCDREMHRKWYTSPRGLELKRRERLLRVFKISVEDYDRMLEEQHGACAICGIVPESKRLSIDHDHATGVVRGLLCTQCNQGLGMFREKPAVLSKAIEYLLKNIPQGDQSVNN